MTPPEYFLRAALVLVEVEARGDGEAEGGQQCRGDQQLHLQHHLHLVLLHRHHLQADLLQEPPANTAQLSVAPGWWLAGSPGQRDQPRPQLLPALQLEEGRVEDDIPGEVVQVVPRPPPAQTLPAGQE